MIEDLDLILTDRGQMVLVIPGAVPSGSLTVELVTGAVRVLAGDLCFAGATGVSSEVLDALAGQGMTLGLIAAPHPARPPVDVTHTAALRDRRI